MALYALDDLDDALAATKRLLVPIDFGTWLRLAFIALFVGSVGGVSGGGGGGGGGGNGGTVDLPPVGDIAFPGRILAILVALAVVAVVVGLVLALVGSVMEFVLVESLRQREVHIRRYARQHWGRGVRLFAFRLLFGLVVVAVVIATLALSVLTLIGGGLAEASPALLVGSLLVVLPILVVVGLLAALVTGFTTVFVVPIMVLEERGVLSAWRRFWPTLVGAWSQFLAYAVAAFVLNVVAGIVIGILLVPVIVVLFVPVGIGGFLAVTTTTTGGVSFALVAVLVLAVLVATLLVVVVGAILEVPFLTYLRYYALFVLGDTDEELDLIPALREEVREPPAPDAGGEAA